MNLAERFIEASKLTDIRLGILCRSTHCTRFSMGDSGDMAFQFGDGSIAWQNDNGGEMKSLHIKNAMTCKKGDAIYYLVSEVDTTG